MVNKLAKIALFIAIFSPFTALAQTPQSFVTPSGAVIAWDGTIISLPNVIPTKPRQLTGNPKKLCANEGTVYKIDKYRHTVIDIQLTAINKSLCGF